MARRIGNPMITTSIRISPDFWELCRKNNISFSEACRVGISIMLSERGIIEYDNNLNIVRRASKATQMLSEKSQELEELKEKLGENA